MTELVPVTPGAVRGKVAEIVSDREVILNRGSDHGIAEGTYLKILNPKVRGIKDPDTGEELGGFSVIKVVVVAIEVRDRLTLARTFRRKTINLGGSMSGLGAFATALAPPRYVEQIERLRRSENAPQPLAPEDSIVDVGDPFEVATEEEIEDVQSVTVFQE